MSQDLKLGKISGSLAVLGVVILLAGALAKITFLIYVGIIIFAGGIASNKFMGI